MPKNERKLPRDAILVMPCSVQHEQKSLQITTTLFTLQELFFSFATEAAEQLNQLELCVCYLVILLT